MGYANNIQALANAGCQVIVDDVVNLGEPFFQDGIIAQAVDNVTTNDDAIYFSSAGNRAARAYENTATTFSFKWTHLLHGIDQSRIAQTEIDKN